MSQEAARILLEDGVKDYQTAKRKAALRFRLTDHHLLPSNLEIEQAVQERQRLFHAESHTKELRKLRETALHAMRTLEQFSPKLTGSVLSGSAGPHSDINLHLFADSSEEVILKLLELGIPYQSSERRLRLRADASAEAFPSLRFSAEDRDIELVIFPAESGRQSPLSPVDAKPMLRADREKLEKLLS
jgi:hypothetical protein